MDIDGILAAVDEYTKLLFICSPNNPTGNNMNRNDIEFLLNNFPGIVVIDEAYINYSNQKSFIQELTEYPNLIVMQTLSKAWGLAALRIGLCYTSLDIIALFNKVKPPYNINEASQELAIEALQHTEQVNNWMKVKDANTLYHYLAENEIVVRNRSKDVLCDNCLRITIGTPEENIQLLKMFNLYE